MSLKNILLFGSGLIVGFGAGVLLTKKYLTDKIQKSCDGEIAEMKKYYESSLYGDTQNEETDDGINSPNEEKSDYTSRAVERLSLEERDEIKRKLQENWTKTTNYASMYRTENAFNESKLAEASTHPLDQGEMYELDPEDDLARCMNCTFFELGKCVKGFVDAEPVMEACDNWSPKMFESLEEAAFEFHQKNKNKPPKIISAEAFGELPPYIDQAVLYFYAYDEVLCEDNEEMIEEPEMFVGDALTKYDFIDSDERVIFVMNYALNTCYEIQKVDASWTDTH